MIAANTSRRCEFAHLVIFFCALGTLSTATAAQTTVHESVRHHKTQVDDPAAADLAKAESAIEKRDFATAEPILTKLTATDPTNYETWFDLGFVYNGLGKSDDAIAAYRKSVAAKADVFESNLNLGLMLAKTGQPDAAKYLQAATSLKPTSNVDGGHARAWLALAHVLETSQPSEALNAYQQSATLQPLDPEPHLAAAQFLEKRGDFPAAQKECESAFKLDKSGDALNCVTEMQLKGKRYGEAEAGLRKLIEQHPGDVNLQLQLAQALEEEEKFDDAAEVYATVLKADPANAAAQSNLAGIYIRRGKFAQAEPLYRELVAKNPSDAELHERLGQTLLKQLKYADAKQEFLVAVKLRPGFGEAYGDLATAASENKDYELAIRAVNARDRLLPPLPVGYFLRASAFDHLRDYKQAAENYHRFLDLAAGKYPDQEWQARHRLIAIEPKK